MESGTREFRQGDTVTINAVIEPGSKIKGIRASYKTDDYDQGNSMGHITFEQGDMGETLGGPVRLVPPEPGPYIEGEVVLEYTVPTNLPTGEYRLYYLEFWTAHRTRLETDQVPESTIKIVPATLEVPSVRSWDIS